jgi:hypothetical protein
MQKRLKEELKAAAIIGAVALARAVQDQRLCEEVLNSVLQKLG